MPEINKPKKKRTPKHNKNLEAAKIRSSYKWIKLRNGYIIQHPLCEVCLGKGIVKEAEEVHHIKPIQTGKDVLEMMDLAYDPYNLMALCKKCHDKIHNNLKSRKNGE